MWQNRLDIFADCYHSARQVLTLETLREREREVRSSERLVWTRSRGEVREIFVWWGRKRISFLRVSQDSLACGFKIKGLRNFYLTVNNKKAKFRKMIFLLWTKRGHRKHAAVTWNSWTISAFNSRRKESRRLVSKWLENNKGSKTWEIS